jgi:hypothetical protein
LTRTNFLARSTSGNAALHLRRLNEKGGKRQMTTTSPAFSASCGSKRRSLLLGLRASTAMAPLAALAQAPEQATNAPVTSPDYPGVTCQVLQAPMRDGTQLRTVTYMPAGGGPFPVVMQRNTFCGRPVGFNSVCKILA